MCSAVCSRGLRLLLITSYMFLHETMQFASVYNKLFKALSVGNQVLTIAMIQAVSMAAWTASVACHLQHVHMHCPGLAIK
jgi:hypothetical protein